MNKSQFLKEMITRLARLLESETEHLAWLKKNAPQAKGFIERSKETVAFIEAKIAEYNNELNTQP